MKENKTQVVIYARSATSPDHEKLNKQVQRCKQYADGEGLSVVAVFKDNGSGNKRYLPGLADLLAFLKTNQPGQIHVLVDEISRISRDDAFFQEFERELGKVNAKVITPFQGINQDEAGAVKFLQSLFEEYRKHHHAQNSPRILTKE